MKKLFPLLFIVSFIIQAQAQKLKEADVPTAVKDAFNLAHPNMKDVDWSKDGNNFEAGYDKGKLDMTASFNDQGVLIETETEIPIYDLPSNVIDYVKKHYPNRRIKEAAKIISAGGVVTYEAEVHGMDLIFDKKGNFIKKMKA